jgi:hypothetical protein
MSEPSTFTAGKEFPVEIWKGSWVGLKESACKQRRRKRALPLLGTESRFPDCPVRSIVSTLCYPSDEAKEGSLK